MFSPDLHRRDWLCASAVGAASLVVGTRLGAAPLSHAPTRFQIACMSLPYARFPLGRALRGIQSAGYKFVAWGRAHREGADQVPVVADDAPPERARELAQRCRDMGLEPLMMFGPSPDEPEALKQRILQAEAGACVRSSRWGAPKATTWRNGWRT